MSRLFQNPLLFGKDTKPKQAVPSTVSCWVPFRSVGSSVEAYARSSGTSGSGSRVNKDPVSWGISGSRTVGRVTVTSKDHSDRYASSPLGSFGLFFRDE